MSEKHTVYGTFAQPLSVGVPRYALFVPENTKRVLWNNLVALMERYWGEENLSRLARECRPRVGQGTVTRIKEQGTSVGLDVLERVAAVFRLKAWQLLVPSFDPERPPQITPMTFEAGDVARIMDSIQDEARRAKAHAIFVQLVELGAPAAASSEPTPAPPEPR